MRSRSTRAIPDGPVNEAPFRLIADVEFGEGVVVYSFTNLYGCQIGDETRIGPFVEIQEGAAVGARCKIQSHSFICRGVEIGKGSTIELGVRPEYLRLGREGLPVRITKVEDIGRRKIVHAELEGRDVAVIVPERSEIPTDARLSFDPKGINLYADSWRLELGA